MHFLRRLFGRLSGSVVDPVLGKLVQRDGQWTGQTNWVHSPQPFALTVNCAGDAPSQTDRDTFLALTRDYQALRTELQDALHRLWTAARDKIEDGPPDFGGSLDLWSRMELQGLALHADGHAELIFGFIDSSRIEGAFIVAVRGHEVKALEYIK